MPGGYTPPSRSGWKITVQCPHGVKVQGSIEMFRHGSIGSLVDPCPEAEAERAAAALYAPPRRATFAEWRAARRFRRELAEGVPWRSTDEPPG